MPQLNNGGNSRCQCGDCNQFFNSLGAFDKHRTGDFSPASARRCLDEAEMLERGMAKNADGFWVTSLGGGVFWGSTGTTELKDPTADLVGDDDYEDLI